MNTKNMKRDKKRRSIKSIVCNSKFIYIFVLSLVAGCSITISQARTNNLELQDKINNLEKQNSQLTVIKEENEKLDEQITNLNADMTALDQKCDELQKKKEEMEAKLKKSRELKQSRIRSSIAKLASTPDSSYLAHYFDVRKESLCTAEDIDAFLKSMNSPLEGLGKTYKQLERENSINAVFVLALSCLESDYGKSHKARTKNNILGYNAVDSNPDRAYSYSSKRECLQNAVPKIAKSYLTKDGKYHNGYTIHSMNKIYCSKSDWKSQIATIMTEFDGYCRDHRLK